MDGVRPEGSGRTPSSSLGRSGRRLLVRPAVNGDVADYLSGQGRVVAGPVGGVGDLAALWGCIGEAERAVSGKLDRVQRGGGRAVLIGDGAVQCEGAQ